MFSQFSSYEVIIYVKYVCAVASFLPMYVLSANRTNCKTERWIF